MSLSDVQYQYNLTRKRYANLRRELTRHLPAGPARMMVENFSAIMFTEGFKAAMAYERKDDGRGAGRAEIQRALEMGRVKL